MNPPTQTYPSSISNESWPSDDLELLGHCPVCGNIGRELLHEDLTDEAFQCAPGRWTMFRCQECDAAYLDPRPNVASIGRAYQTYFTHDVPQSGSMATNKPISSMRRLARSCLNSYRNAYWHMGLTPTNNWGRYLVACALPLRAQVHQQMRNLPRQPPRTGAQLLDVGCGNGAFLELARSAGWQVHGLDFDPKAVAAARQRGLDVMEGDIAQLSHQSATYDWICCSHVIEHVHDPIDLLRQLRNLLRPGGHLWLQTPNIASLGYAQFGNHWRGLEPPRHLTLFTPEGLQHITTRAGLVSRAFTLPLLTSFSVHCASQSLVGYSKSTLPHKVAQLQSLVFATWQSLLPRRAEFITLLAQRPFS